LLSVAFRCQDRFGDYGIVGFSVVETGTGPPLLRDFVISCRVAQKKVEHSYIMWLANHVFKLGVRSLRARLVRTKKNGPIAAVFSDLNFRNIGNHRGGAELLELDLVEEGINLGEIIDVEEGMVLAEDRCRDKSRKPCSANRDLRC